MTRSIAFNAKIHKPSLIGSQIGLYGTSGRASGSYGGSHESASKGGVNAGKIKRLAKKFMAYRAAQREANEPVDSFCRRGDDTPRFAYFD